MNRLNEAQRARVVAALVDGNSVRATCRIIGVAKGTVLRLIEEVGAACLDYQRHAMVNLPCQRVQIDEIWAFVGAKEANVPKEERGHGRGDAWTWTAICADTKVIPCWYIGLRDRNAAHTFVADVAARMAGRIQLTTDALNHYLGAVESAFGYHGVDYGRIAKTYGTVAGPQGRYSPAVCTGATKDRVLGHPDHRHISTSYVERANLSMRMGMRRFTRLTNGFSKKLENHKHAQAIFFMAYNYVRPHGTLTKRAKGVHTTPAMAAGLTDHVWALSEVLAMVAAQALAA